MSSRNQVLTNNVNSFPNNNSGQITPQVLRDFNADFINSVVFTDQTGSMSVNSASFASNAGNAATANNATSASFALTASFALNAGGGGATNTGSLLADATSSNADITFTRGNGTTFNVNINNVANATSASFASTAATATSANTATSASFATNAANAANATSASFSSTASFTPNAIVTASVNVSTITFTKGNGSTFNITVAQSGSVATASYAIFAESASNAVNSQTASFILGGVASASYAASSSYAANAELLDGLDSTAFVKNSQTSSMSVLSASYAATASSADVFNIRTSLTASGLKYPTTDGLEFQFLETDGVGNLFFGDVHTIFETVYTGENITKSDPLYISGSQGANPIVYKADAANAAKMPVVYIASETIAAGNTTRGIVLGLIEGIDLTGYPAGTEVYVAAGSGWTSTRPTGSAIVQILGVVTKEGVGGKGLILNPGPVELPNLQAGYAWVGDANGVPQAIPTSSIQNVISSSYSAFAASIASGLNISASNITVTNNLTVNGTASFGYLQTVSGSAVIIGEQYIVLNADTPTAPFAGIQVYDTGSAQTASLEWNGNGDNWIVVEETGQSAGILTGPTGSKGSEVFPTNNTILKGTGHHTVGNSNITDNGSIVSINSNTQVTGSLVVSAGITGSLLGTSSFANNATSASYATTASFAETAVSASFAPSTPAFPFTGSAGISGSLVSNGDVFVTGSVLIKPTTVTSEQPFPIIEISDGTGFEGNIIISRNTTATTTGSIVVSGSNNIFLPTNGGSNSHINGGGAVGWRGNSSIVTVGSVTMTGSLGTGYARLYPQFLNSVVNSNVTITDNRPVGTTTSPLTLSSVALNGAITTTLTTGSTTVSATNLIGNITINSTGSTGAVRVISNSLLGNSTITNDSNSGTVLTNSVVNGTTTTLFLSGSTNGTLQNALVVGNNLTVTGSNTTAANLGSAFVGRFNDLGTTALAANTAFAVGTGTAAGSRRTSLHVSSSGLTTISNGLITGSLIGTASFATNATSASFAETASFYGGSVVSASFATTASYAATASFVFLSQTSSLALTASFYGGSVTSASYASTASFVGNAGTLTQNLVLSGSVNGEVKPLTISSNTASMDCATANFFTLTLVSGSTTFLNPTNFTPGETVNLRVTQASSLSGSLTFAGSVKQSFGNSYVPSKTGSAVDVLTFIAFDSTNLLMTNVNNLA